MKVELEWLFASRVLPEPDRRVFFCTTEDSHDDFHVGEWSEPRYCFLSDRANSVGEREEWAVLEVWCWAYPPEVPT